MGQKLQMTPQKMTKNQLLAVVSRIITDNMNELRLEIEALLDITIIEDRESADE